MDTLEKMRRQRPEVCSCCGWNMVLTEVGYECHNVQGCAAYSTADPDEIMLVPTRPEPTREHP
jgi:hypothetical protein